MLRIPLLPYAVRFMNRLSFIKKFLVVSVLFVFPLAILGGALFKEIGNTIEDAHLERQGIVLLHQSYELMLAAVAYRDLQLVTRVNSSETLQGKIAEQTKEVEKQIAKFEELLSIQSGKSISKQFEILKTTWQTTKTTSAGAAGGPNIQFLFYDTLVTQVELLINVITYDRKLIHEPSLKNILIVNVLIKDLPNVFRDLGRARSYGAYALSLPALDYETYNTLDKIYDEVLEGQLLLEQSLDHALSLQLDQKQLTEAAEIIMDGIDTGANYFYENIIEKDFVEDPWDNYYKEMTVGFNEILRGTRILLPIIDRDLVKRIEQRQRDLYTLLLITLLLSVLIFYLYAAVYFSINSHISHFAKKAHQVAGGDLTVKLDIESKDELSQLYSTFNEMLIQLKEHQNKLLQAEKMASLGGMISGVAHEMNTPMGIVKTAMSQVEESIEHVQKQLSDNTMTRTDLEHFLADSTEAVHLMSQNTERCISLISTFKQLNVYQERESKEVVDLCDLLDSIPKIFTREDRHHVITVKRPDHLTSKVDKELLLLVLGNLVSNAYEHAFANRNDDGGEITIEGIEAEDHIKILVSDNGQGFDEESIEKAFEPFFTTKRNQGCIGLGLHIVFIIVTQALDGIIEINSEISEGTQVRMRFPKAD